MSASCWLDEQEVVVADDAGRLDGGETDGDLFIFTSSSLMGVVEADETVDGYPATDMDGSLPLMILGWLVQDGGRSDDTTSVILKLNLECIFNSFQSQI